MMLVSRFSNISKNQLTKGNKICCALAKSFSHDNNNSEKRKTLGEIGSKYKEFDEKDSKIILDINEMRLQHAAMVEEDESRNAARYEGLNLQRGTSGVFDIEDLIDTLKRENAEDVFVACVSKEIKYVDYIVVASAKSYKHMHAIIQFVRRIYKHKRHHIDQIPKIEGKDSQDWMALDLGNIALHIFSKKSRMFYDLDSLWALGSKFDDECNKKEPVVEILDKHSIYLSNLKPFS
ncbi:mitochondrial assembly of ribosomal large subunit protein 1 [Cylas formicarius]|uniref:mitochondrial assembly of ribosomal large subunit protein 1 n=1 Tax=Cylas formicarius TaxID=197179 RepID=UPI0029588C4A|nr:mitochondrial assembly of ribosomal large subunit protein 1 [Cylas formicarius]